MRAADCEYTAANANRWLLTCGGMNIKQYFAHLGYWVRTFPRWSDNEHTTTGIAGSGEYYCLLCDFVEIEKPNTACTGRRKRAPKNSSKSGKRSGKLRRQ